MISTMLVKLEEQCRYAVDLQRTGKSSEALGLYELAFEALHFYEGLGYSGEAASIYRLVLAAQTTPEHVLYFHSLIQFHRKKHTAAVEAVHAALLLSPRSVPFQHLKARALTAQGDHQTAQMVYDELQAGDPASGSACDGFFILAAEREMPGEDYYYWLKKFHEWLTPATYVEIGLGHGRSLALAGPGTKAIGIDPYQGFWKQLNYVSPHCPASLFPLTSDDFFRQYNLLDVMGQQSFDLAFIDGLHLFEQALKDFINLERYAREDSVILIHDCLPIAPIVAERDRCTGFWTGDVWRIIPCLKTFRPDLKIMTIPTTPSGLGVVTNLDAASTVLRDNFADIVRYYLSLRCTDNFAQLRLVCNVGIADNEYIANALFGQQTFSEETR